MKGITMMMAKMGLAAAACCGMAAAQETCSVVDESINVVNLAKFTEDNIKVLTSPGKLLPDGVVQLTQTDSGGTASGAYTTNRTRLTDGFIASFEFSISNPEAAPGDGLAFLVQNFRDSNLLLGTKGELGFRSVVKNYLALAFETCPLEEPTCSTKRVLIYKRGSTGAYEVLANNTLAVNIIGEKVEAQLIYEESTGKVTAKVAGVEVATGNAGSLLDIFAGDRYGWLGFSASTSAQGNSAYLAADVRVYNLRVNILPPKTQLDAAPQNTIVGRSVFFTVNMLDSCQKVTSFPEDMYNATVEAVLRFAGSSNGTEYTPSDPPVKGRDFLEPAVDPEFVEASGDLPSRFTLRFDIPFITLGRWDLELTVNGVASKGSPYREVLVSLPEPEPEGFPTWGLALLIVVIVLIVLGLAYAVRRLVRYRRKLRENKEDIEAGKEKHHLDMLERDVSFNMNPMLGSLEDMRKKLAENEAELARLRDGKSERYDDDHTVSELQAQNAELREEMNKLKKEAQQNEALNTNYRRDLGSGATVKRKEFEQSRV